jgi:hypothetical protein
MMLSLFVYTVTRLATKASRASETPQPTLTPSWQPNPLKIGLLQGIRTHSGTGSKANSVIDSFNKLSTSEQEEGQ